MRNKPALFFLGILLSKVLFFGTQIINAQHTLASLSWSPGERCWRLTSSCLLLPQLSVWCCSGKILDLLVCVPPKFLKIIFIMLMHHIRIYHNDLELTDFFCAASLIKLIVLTNLAPLVACTKAKARVCGHGHLNSSWRILCWLNLTLLTRVIGTRANVTVRSTYPQWLALCGTNNCIIEGRGEFVSATGHSYNGDWLNDRRHGQGEYRLSDGIVYSGELAYWYLLAHHIINIIS